MKTWKIMLFFGLISLGLMINRSYAEEDKGVVTLETVVVTGTRTEQIIERVPANVTVINEEDIKDSNAKTIVDLLRSEEGIVVRDLLGNGKTSQVDLRGFGETGAYNTLVLVDGRRVNEIDISGVDWTQIPLEQIERIEIVRGSGTVLYGDNAVGGVINIITKIPSEKPAFTAGTTAGSFGRHEEHLSVSGGSDHLSASLFASHDASDGYRDNGELTRKDIGGKIVLAPSDSLSLDLSGSYHSDQYGLPGAIPEDQLAVERRATQNPDDEGESEDAYLKLGFDMSLGRNGSLVTDISYRDRESEAVFPDPSFPFATKSATDTWGITPRYVWEGEIAHHDNTLITGIDFYRSQQKINSYSGFFSPVASLTGLTDIERDSRGFYFNNEFAVVDDLFLSMGARSERVRYDLNQQDLSAFPLAPLDETVTDRESAYSAGLTLLYSEKSSLFARINRSLRFPLTDEIVVFDYIAGKIRVNSDLKPQRGQHYEVGIRHFFTSDTQGTLTLFRAAIRDEVFFNPAPVFSNENHPETLHQGIEIGSKAKFFKNVTVFGNYTYEEATFERAPFKGNEIPAVPKHKANIGFRIHDFVPGFIFSADYNYIGSSYAISDQANAFDKVSAYNTINARFSYEWKMLKAFLGVNNLSNEKYSSYAVISGAKRYFYPAPERSWLAGLEIVF